ncbi:MAG: hypothetical protein V4558_02195 [Gemmatimonadota bacterium]
MRSFAALSPLLLLAAAAAGCSGTSSSDNTGRVALKLSTIPAGSSGASLMAPGLSVTLGGDVILIEDVQLVARKIKLQRVNGSCPTPVVDETSGTDADEAGTDECSNLRLGPMLIAPPLIAGVAASFTADVPIGTYDKMTLQIHKPAGSKDAAFLSANPDFSGVSIRVTGTFNTTPFTFTTPLTSVVEIAFPQVIEVTGGDVTALTLKLDVRDWFLADGGASLVNPLTLTQQGRSRIEQNIRASFHVFRDENGDGIKD